MMTPLTRIVLPLSVVAALVTSLRAEDPSELPPLAPSVAPFVEKAELAGAVMLVASKTKILAHEAIGFADVAEKKPMKTDSVFWIASQTKPIAASALMVLVDEGKVKLDDPVEKYLPEFKGQMAVVEKDDAHRLLKKPAAPITIRQCLSHVSGLPFKSGIEEPALDQSPLRICVRSYAMLPLDYEPESKYVYSNAGINTAGRIVEVVSGMPFEQFLDERICKPLGMKDTTFFPTTELAERIAKAYKPGQGGKGLEETKITFLSYPLTDRHQRFCMPGGGLFSTAKDVSRFYQMLLNEGELDGKRILSADAVKELTKRQTPTTVKENYGLGFSVSPTTFGHGGAYSTQTTADKEKGIVWIWLVQHAGFPGEGGKAQETFRKAAFDALSKKAP